MGSQTLPDAGSGRPTRLILYSRPVCHLCALVKPTVARLCADFGLELEVRNVEESPDWETRYGAQVPVAFLGATKLFKYRATEVELRSRIQRIIAS